MRERLLRAVRHDGLRAIHPHIGSRPVWELAGLLSECAGRTVQVIAPPPAVTEWVNDKLAMAGLAQRLFGSEAIPRTEHAADFAHAAEVVSRLAVECGVITLKLPDSVGGGGNIVVDADVFAGRPLSEIRDALRDRFNELTWEGRRNCSSAAGTQVSRAPSAQLWIPPEPDGLPIVEGLFEQDLGDRRGMFVGARRAELPTDVSASRPHTIPRSVQTPSELERVVKSECVASAQQSLSTNTDRQSVSWAPLGQIPPT